MKVFNHATSKCCTSMYYAYTIRFRKIDVWGVLRIYRLLMSGLDSFPFFSPSKLLRSPLQKKEKKKKEAGEEKTHGCTVTRGGEGAHVRGREKRTREDAKRARERTREAPREEDEKRVGNTRTHPTGDTDPRTRDTHTIERERQRERERES